MTETATETEATTGASPASKADAKSRTRTEATTKADSKAGSDAGSKADTKADSKADSKAGADAGSKADTKAGSEVDTKADRKADSKADSKAGADAGSEADMKADSKVGSKADSEAGADAGSEADTKAVPDADAAPSWRASGLVRRLSPVRPLRAAARRLPAVARRLSPRRQLRRLPSWWPLGLCLVVGAGCGAGYGMLATPQYSATGYLVAVPAKDSDPQAALGFAQAYGRVATSPAVLRQAQNVAGEPVARLRAGVRSATSPDAPMIEITGTAPRPQLAAVRANAVATALTDTSADAAEQLS
ncbi:hypothetical protein GL263_21945, partial [Streptomyces durbertensis]|nr:hypothetical protein [Streptomyces durbertensis]